jgi:DNA-binding SARP family transcriptional activator
MGRGHNQAAKDATQVRPKGARRIAAEAFDHFPFGILVAAEDGTIVAANDRAAEMLDLVEGEPMPRCCEVLGCGRKDSPLEGICMTRLAQERGAPLPEVRTDLPHGRRVTALWVTAAPAGSRVVFNLRPGDRRDRRRRTEPHWIAGPHLRIVTLGRTRIESREGPIGGSWLKQRPGELLKFLVTERHRVAHAEEIAHTLWPHAGPAALGNVRHFVHALRDRLEPQREKGSPSSFILARGGGYTLNIAQVSVDADKFEAQVRAATAAIGDGDPARAAEHAERALDLYHGDYLDDEPYAEWAFLERERLRHLVGTALRMLAHIRSGQEDIEGAVSALRRLADLDVFDLDVQRDLIRLCLRTGHRSEAMRRYETLRQRMVREFGEVPDFELADLVQHRVERHRAS